ncbi:MAG: hypothetical protein ACQCN5_11815 [Candidatus Bathyarchaeia archaeon]|jgi:hypothetical protein
MRNTNKTLALLLTLIIAMSCLTLSITKPVNAQTVPKPFVPEFTVQYFDFSYDIPVTTTTTTDPYTGEKVTTRSGGEHVTNRYINITIKNQPYSSIVLPDGNVTELYYVVRVKGYFSSYWREPSSFDNLRGKGSGSGFTVFTIKIGSDDQYFLNHLYALNIPVGGKIDFQVSAQVGYYYHYLSHLIPTSQYFCVTEGDWSDTQTITIGEESSISHSTPTPSVPEYSWFAIVPLLLSLIPVALIVRQRKSVVINQ